MTKVCSKHHYSYRVPIFLSSFKCGIRVCGTLRTGEHIHFYSMTSYLAVSVDGGTTGGVNNFL